MSPPATMRKRPTMEDIAREANVSKATVSRVLAGIEAHCTAETAARVRDCAKRLGYVPNSVAASLRSQQSHTVGLILADVSNPFFGAVAKGVEERLSRTGYSVLFGNSNNSLESEEALVRTLVEKRVDGLIVAPSASTGAHLEAVAASGIKVVLVDSDIPEIDLDCVSIDNHMAARKAVRHLLELGHERIAIVTGPLDAVFDRQRLEGYRATLERAGIAFDEVLVLKSDLTMSGGVTAVEAFLTLDPRPTALFVANNMMTLGVITALSRAGVRVPEEVSLVGFDDQDWYAVFRTPLTAVSNPAHEIGTLAADRLLNALGQSEPASVQRVFLNCDLVIRDSTAAPV